MSGILPIAPTHWSRYRRRGRSLGDFSIGIALAALAAYACFRTACGPVRRVDQGKDTMKDIILTTLGIVGFVILWLVFVVVSQPPMP